MEYPKKVFKFKCSSCKEKWEEEVEMTGIAASSACPKCPTRMSVIYTQKEAVELLAFYINTYEGGNWDLIDIKNILMFLDRACSKDVSRKLPKDDFNTLMKNIISHPLVACTKVESFSYGITFHLMIQEKERILELTY